ncbi:hypothetical protein F3Y30_04670 [Sinorhizobium sp. BG8]|nr:hypothetical protein F3Y30_04670 [Sinorhizobium sp. BG8]
MGLTTFGVIGGGGWLAGALLRPAIVEGVVSPSRLVLSSRSGSADGFGSWPAIRLVSDNELLASMCDVVMLSVRPAQLDDIDLDLSDKLVISVMAGIDIDELEERFGSERIIRAMPNACAEQRLSFTPWFATDSVTDEEADFAHRLFSASGRSQLIADEAELDYYTALTGSGPAFLALFADAMIRHAVEVGIDPEAADAAVRQLFLGASMLIAESEASPADIIDTFMEHRGTTAAGLATMIDEDIATPIFRGSTRRGKRRHREWHEAYRDPSSPATTLQAYVLEVLAHCPLHGFGRHASRRGERGIAGAAICARWLSQTPPRTIAIPRIWRRARVCPSKPQPRRTATSGLRKPRGETAEGSSRDSPRNQRM